MRLNSLAFRLFATSAAWTLIVLPVAGVLIYGLYRSDFQASFDETLSKLVTQISFDSLDNSAGTPVAPPNRFEPLFEVTHSGWYWQIKPLDGADGPVLVSPSLATGRLPSPYEAKIPESPDGNRWMNTQGPDGKPVRLVEVIDSLRFDPKEARYAVAVAGPIEWLDSRIHKFRNWLTVALTLAGIGLAAVTWFQVRFGLLPLRQIERGLAAIRSGKATHLAADLPSEIEPLQAELNALIQSNQDIVDRARTQVGNLAHALKTPLAVIINEARQERSAFGAKVAEQAEVMRIQIGHYLDRARMAARVGVIGRAIPVEAAALPLVRTLERIYAEKGVRIAVMCPREAVFQGEKHDLEEMLGNLLDNACKWARGRVFLTVVPSGPEPPARQKRLFIDIEDDGPGVSEAQRAKLGTRGLRLDETKPGSGLGMSIAADLAHSYRGNFRLEESRHGGLLARLELPAA